MYPISFRFAIRVLNGTVTDGSLLGAQIHQQSNYIGGPLAASEWSGQLQLMPASG